MRQLLMVLVLISQQAMAQNKTFEARKTIEVEVDPIAYALKGYSLHGIYAHKRLRFDLGVFGIEQPGSITGNKDFTTMTRGFGLKVNYIITGIRGLYAGLDAGYAANDVKDKNTMQTDIGHNLSLGAHAGYRFFLFPKKSNFLSGLYITPWAGISYNHVYDEVKLTGYKEGNVGYFATVHIGYRF